MAPLQFETKAAINYVWNVARHSWYCNQMRPHREKKTLYHASHTTEIFRVLITVGNKKEN